MPELPEVETTRLGLAPHLIGRRVQSVTLRRPDLRWPIPPEIRDALPGQRIDAVRRRAKYLLFETTAGSALVHLGMSGCLRVLPASTPVGAHDHVDFGIGQRQVLRFTDPRRFGCLLWQMPGEVHSLLHKLGPEPLSAAFNGDWLYAASRGRRVPVKAVPRALSGAGRCRQTDSCPRHHPRRHHLARFPAPGQPARLFCPGTVRLRARRTAVSALRQTPASGRDRPAQQRVVRKLPALNGAARVN